MFDLEADLVVSDGAPDVSGMHDIDEYIQVRVRARVNTRVRLTVTVTARVSVRVLG